MHKIAIVLLSLMLIVAPMPLYAQAIPVTPEPTSVPFTPEQLRFLEALAPALKEVASSDASTINFIVVIVGVVLLLFVAGFVILAVWVARGGLTTFMSMIRDANARAREAEEKEDRARDELEKQLERRRRMDEQNLETAKAQTETLIALKESLNAPLQRLHPVIEAINSHTTEKFDEAIREFQALRNEMVSKEDMSTYTRKFDEALAKLLEAKVETAADPAPSVKTGVAERGTVGEVDGNT